MFFSFFICFNSIEYIVIFLVGISTSCPFLAYSYSFFPFTFIAEYIGGFCSISPSNVFSVFSMLLLFDCSSIFCGISFSSIIFPSASSVSVLFPNFNSTRYFLSWFTKYFEHCVPFPIKIGKTPCAKGSNVPVCPTFSPVILFIFATMSCEVHSLGLYIFIMPSTNFCSFLYYFNTFFISFIIFSFTCSIFPWIKHPAAFGWPPPPKI